jgi:hypothetical protein
MIWIHCLLTPSTSIPISHSLMATIANCPVPFRFQCPKLWKNLEPTDESDIRFCPTCQKKVYLCRDMEDVARHTQSGDCIAIRTSARREHYVGDVGPQ